MKRFKEKIAEALQTNMGQTIRQTADVLRDEFPVPVEYSLCLKVIWPDPEDTGSVILCAEVDGATAAVPTYIGGAPALIRQAYLQLAKELWVAYLLAAARPDPKKAGES